MEYGSFIGTIVASVAASITAGYYGLRKLRRDFAADGAERYANDWHQKVIARQDRELERMRNDMTIIREMMTQSNARILSLENENKIKQKVINDLIHELRLVKRGVMRPEDINTGVYEDVRSPPTL